MVNTRKKTLAIVSTVAAGAALWGGVALAGPTIADAAVNSDHSYASGRGPSHRPPASRKPRPTTTQPGTQRPPTGTQRPPTGTQRPPTGTQQPPTAPPTQSGSSSGACSKASGDPATINRPGVGAVTVTVTVCGDKITAASSTQSQSNWKANTQALPAMDKLVLQYAKTNISMISYSGATLTSAAYRTSLQSAMSKAGI